MSIHQIRGTVIAALLVGIGVAAEIVFIRTPSWLIDVAIFAGLLLLGLVVMLWRRVVAGFR